MCKQRIPLRYVLKRIQIMDEKESEVIMKGIIAWYKRYHPDYELLVWSLPSCDLKMREQQIDLVTAFLKNHPAEGRNGSIGMRSAEGSAEKQKTLKRYRF